MGKSDQRIQMSKTIYFMIIIYERVGEGKSIETQSRLVVAWDWEYECGLTADTKDLLGLWKYSKTGTRDVCTKNHYIIHLNKCYVNYIQIKLILEK